MNDELGNRVVYAPRGRNAEDDLAACILRAAKIFMMDGQLAWIADGKRVPVVRDVVIELCRQFVVTEHPVERDGKWIVERRPFVPDELKVRNLIRESLPKRAPVVQAEAPPKPQEKPQRPREARRWRPDTPRLEARARGRKSRGGNSGRRNCRLDRPPQGK